MLAWGTQNTIGYWDKRERGSSPNAWGASGRPSNFLSDFDMLLTIFIVLSFVAVNSDVPKYSLSTIDSFFAFSFSFSQYPKACKLIIFRWYVYHYPILKAGVGIWSFVRGPIISFGLLKISGFMDLLKISRFVDLLSIENILLPIGSFVRGPALSFGLLKILGFMDLCLLKISCCKYIEWHSPTLSSGPLKIYGFMDLLSAKNILL